MRLRIVVLMLALVAVVVVPLSADAGGVKAAVNSVLPPNPALPPPAKTPDALIGRDPGIYRFDNNRSRGRHDRPPHGHRPNNVIVVPQTVYVTPGSCWRDGYWTYQWVPQWASYNAWVDAQWSPDGQWIAAHYEPRWYSTGAYQPYWVQGDWGSC